MEQSPTRHNPHSESSSQTISRRKLLKQAGAGAVTLFALGGLTGCGNTEQPSTPTPDQKTDSFPGDQQTESTPEPTETVSPTITEQIEAAGVNQEAMTQLAQVNTTLFPSDESEHMGLRGVRLSLEQVYPEISDKLLVGSGYLARDVLRSESDYFAEIPINNRENLYRFPKGSIFVFQPNTDGSYDYADGEHHGGISIVVDNDMQGHVTLGNDHQHSLDTDLLNLHGEVSAFILKAEPNQKMSIPDEEPSSETLPPALSFLQAGKDLMEAYQAVNDGYTYPGVADQVAAYLLQKGYSEEQVTAYQNRRGENGSGQHSIIDGCAQCLGWIGEVTALWSGTNAPDRTLNIYGAAANINPSHESGTPLEVGFTKFYPEGRDYNVIPQPGDIVVNDIHIAIVSHINNDGTITLLESNGAISCGVTDYRNVNQTGFVFYRAKEA